MSPLPPTAVPAPTRLPWNVKVLGVASLLNDIASEMLFPLLPLFVSQVLNAGKMSLGAVEGVADALGALLRLWSGSWSDRLGRRKGFVVAGYFLAGVARPLVSLATAPWHVVAARTVDRLGKGLRSSARDALLVDSTPPEIRGWAFGFHRAMDHVGAAIGPLLAALLLWKVEVDLRTVFAWSIVPGVAVALFVWLGLREPPSVTQAGKKFRWTLAPLGPKFRWYLAAVACFALGNSSDVLLLARVRELGLPGDGHFSGEWLVPLLWSAFHVLKSIGNAWGGKAADRFGPWPMLVGGWLIYAVVNAGFGFATTLPQAVALFAAYAAFYALAEPAEKALVARLAPAEHKGLAYGWFHFTNGIIALPANLLCGYLYDTLGPAAAFGFGGAMALVAVGLLAVQRRDVSESAIR